MTTDFKIPQITMELYETEISELQKFIANEKAGEFTEEWLILYNFATDCKYSGHIQPELIRYLLPFYLKAMEKAVFYDNHDAEQIYEEFNSAVFLNKKSFVNAVGEKSYQYIMMHYISQTIRKMEMQKQYLLEWVPLFNTTVVFEQDNIQKIFHKIFEGSLKVKLSFFQYLSVLLFKESDNLLAVNETRPFWTSDIWYFDNWDSSGEWLWSAAAVEFFDKEINSEKIKTLFKEVEPLIHNILGLETTALLRDEMSRSFAAGIFDRRKAEYLKKISCPSERALYWDTTF